MADALIENFRPGVKGDAWGSITSLAADCPSLVYVSISGYGQHGAWKDRRAYAPFVHGEAGYLHTAAQLRDRPVEHDPMSIADVAAAKDATIALLAALAQRSRTGRGQHIDISLAHSIFYFNEFAGGLLSGARAPRSGSTAQTLFTTSDGQSFSAGNPISSEVFATLCRAFGRPELIDDERFADSGARRERRAEVIATLQAALAELGGIDEVETVLRDAGLAVGRVRRVVDVAETPWATERTAVVTAHVAGGDDVVVPSAPWRFSAAVDQAPHELGAFGSDNDEVVSELLGLDADQIAELYRRGVLCRDEVARTEP
ncbi:MAG: CaiB/BaiF CoA-transferase family protein [Alphaproteobacteria bacterium]